MMRLVRPPMATAAEDPTEPTRVACGSFHCQFDEVGTVQERRFGALGRVALISENAFETGVPMGTATTTSSAPRSSSPVGEYTHHQLAIRRGFSSRVSSTRRSSRSRGWVPKCCCPCGSRARRGPACFEQPIIVHNAESAGRKLRIQTGQRSSVDSYRSASRRRSASCSIGALGSVSLNHPPRNWTWSSRSL